MEFHLISWINYDSWRKDISCRHWSLAFPKTKTGQCQRQSCSNAAEQTVEKGRRREAGNMRLREIDRNTEMETDRTEANKETETAKPCSSSKARTRLYGSWNPEQTSPFWQLCPDPSPHQRYMPTQPCQFGTGTDQQPLLTSVICARDGNCRKRVDCMYWERWASEYVEWSVSSGVGARLHATIK